MPYINTITHPNENPKKSQGSCIDHIIIKSKLNFRACKFINKFTDHYPILISNNCRVDSDKLLIKRVDYNKLFELSKKEECTEIQQINDLNIATNMLVDKIEKICSHSLKIITSKSKKPRSPWITPALICSTNRKNELYLLHNNNPKNINFKNDFLNYQKKLK